MAIADGTDITRALKLSDEEVVDLATEFDAGQEIRDQVLRAVEQRSDRRSLLKSLGAKIGGAALVAALGARALEQEAGAWWMSPSTYVTPIAYRSWPVTCWVGQGGHTNSLNYWAIDIGTSAGTPVFATKSGTAYPFWDPYGGGNVVKIKHNDGLETWLAHLSSFSVGWGQWVTGSYTRVGFSGSSGSASTGPHLHWGLVVQGTSQSVDIRGVPGVTRWTIYP